jgi:hypothetical protein
MGHEDRFDPADLLSFLLTQDQFHRVAHDID